MDAHHLKPLPSHTFTNILLPLLGLPKSTNTLPISTSVSMQLSTSKLVMPPAKRRKLASIPKEEQSAHQKPSVDASESSEIGGLNEPKASQNAQSPVLLTSEVPAVDRNKERQERFKALQARAVSPSSNLSILYTF